MKLNITLFIPSTFLH